MGFRKVIRKIDGCCRCVPGAREIVKFVDFGGNGYKKVIRKFDAQMVRNVGFFSEKEKHFPLGPAFGDNPGPASALYDPARSTVFRVSSPESLFNMHR